MMTLMKNTKKKIFSSSQIGEQMNYDDMPNLYKEVVHYYESIAAEKKYIIKLNHECRSVPFSVKSDKISHC